MSFIELNDSAGDQGDNAYRMFLIALLFADTTRRWSLDARRRRKRNPAFPETDGGEFRWILIMANNLAIVVLAFQVCSIYMSGGLYKAGGTAWQHGFAVYNPLQTQQFGTWPVLSDLVTAWGPGVVVISWGSILFQVAFPFMLFNRWTRVVASSGSSPSTSHRPAHGAAVVLADDDRRRRDLHQGPQLREVRGVPPALVDLDPRGTPTP